MASKSAKIADSNKGADLLDEFLTLLHGKNHKTKGNGLIKVKK